MTKMSSQELRLITIQDQGWEYMMQHKEDIARIGYGGHRGDEQDDKLVRIVMLVVTGDLCYRQAKAEKVTP